MDNGQGVGIRLSNPMKRCRRKAGVSFHRVRRDSRFSGARGAAPCTERSDAGPRIADAVSGQGAAPQDARYMVVRLCIEVRPLFQRDYLQPLIQMLILMFCKNPSMLVAVVSDASVNRPSSVKIGVSSTALMDTAILAQEAITFRDSTLYC